MSRSIMWDYIAQEPETLALLLGSGQTDNYAGTEKNIEAIYFVAHGSSFNAAVTVSDFFTRMTGIRVYAMTPGNFMHGGSNAAAEKKERTVIAVISQTGTSSGAVDTLAMVRDQGFRTLAVTATAGSPVEELADKCLYLMCGPEDSNAKTKGYSATLLLLIMLAVSIGRMNGHISSELADVCLEEARGMVSCIGPVIRQAEAFCEQNAFGKELNDLYVLGSGMNFGTAQEGQLKHMETCCIPTMFNDIGEFSHGMHRSITERSSVLLIRTKDRDDTLTLQAYRYLKGITEHVWMIDAAGETFDDGSVLSIPCFMNTQSVLLTTLCIQVMSVYAPEKTGLDPNRDAHNDFTDYVGTRVNQR